MSNDQLSWEQILLGEEGPGEKVADEKNAGSSDLGEAQASANSNFTDKTTHVFTSNIAAASSATDSSVTTATVAKTSRTTRSSTKTKSKKKFKAPAEDEGAPNKALYSKKDWSKLEFEKTSTVSVEQTELKSEPSDINLPLSTSKVTASTTVTAVTSESIDTKSPAFDNEATTRSSSMYVRSRSESLSIETDGIISEDDLQEPKTSEEPQVITVSELNRHIREILEGRFPLIWLKGEISNFKAHTSGHFYFSLKDSKAQINAVMFRGFNSQLRFRPEDGMEVLVRGKITVYEPRGNYQIFCELMEPVGAGALQKAFEQLKAKLQKEGLFDLVKKRPLPALPKHIAIMTSPTGAAIRDMLNVLGRRFKSVSITVIPCKVQGDQAPREIVAAIHLAQRLPDVDVMIVGRGGGSIEDLWAFNDESVARAIAGCRVPVVSAVGHEVDFTIADFVADLRAPTPSAAAELVVKNAADLSERVANLTKSLKLALLRKLSTARQLNLLLSKRLVDPQRRIQDASIRCDELRQRLDGAIMRSFESRRLKMALLAQRLGTPLPLLKSQREGISALEMRLRTGMKNLLVRKREGIERNMALLDSLSPLKVLDRGYSMVVRGEEIVTHATSLEVGQTVTVRMCKGSIEAQVTKIEVNKR